MTANFQISGKANDGRIYVIGGDNFSEFAQNLQDMYGPQADRVIEDFAFLVDPPSPSQSQPAAPSASAASSTPPAPGAPTCSHGARVYRTGTGSKGAWAAWFCPTPKGTPDQCKAEWA